MPSKNYPVSIRFIGDKFSGNKGVPISELGESLISIQRLVNRAYLLTASASTDEEMPFAVKRGQKNIRNIEMREKLSLHIEERSKGSDIYALNWFANIASAQAPLINAILVEIAGVASAYIAKRIFEGPRDRPVRVNANASALYNEFANLAYRIGRVGEIDEIQIKFKSMRKPVVIDTRFKEYIEVLDGLEYPGEVQTISGNVMTAHVLPKKSVDIITSTRRRVKVWVSGQAFRSILRALDKYDNPMFDFKGIPMLRMGDGPWEFREMEATKVRTIPSHLRKSSGSTRHRKKQETTP